MFRLNVHLLLPIMGLLPVLSTHASEAVSVEESSAQLIAVDNRADGVVLLGDNLIEVSYSLAPDAEIWRSNGEQGLLGSLKKGVWVNFIYDAEKKEIYKIFMLEE